jgi:hypothetical protein
MPTTRGVPDLSCGVLAAAAVAKLTLGERVQRFELGDQRRVPAVVPVAQFRERRLDGFDKVLKQRARRSRTREL